MKSKHNVQFIGMGIHRDAEGELWGDSENDNIKLSREFESDKTEEQFLEERPDIQFMINYGQMKIVTSTVDGKDKGGKDNTPVAPVKPAEEKPVPVPVVTTTTTETK